MKSRRFVFSLFLAAACFIGGRFTAEAYTLSLVAQPGDTIDGRTLLDTGGGRLNDLGQVAFYGSFAGGNGVFTQDKLLIAKGDVIDGKSLIFLGGGSFNDSGTIALVGSFDTSAGVFTQDDLLISSGAVIGGRTLQGVDAPAINNAGTVAFRGSFQGGGHFGVFTQDSLVAEVGSIIGGKTLTTIFTGVGLGDNGVVAFHAGFSGGAGVFTATSLLAAPGKILSDGFTIGSIDNLDELLPMNASGTVAMVVNNRRAVVTQYGRIASENQNIGGFTIGPINSVDLNDHGTVAFQTSVDGHGAIFTQDGLVANVGDIVEGKTITDVSRPSINNNGEIAFFANFSDGTYGIVLSNGAVVPELSTTSLILVGAGWLGVRRRRV
jgi:hypothetical protein